MDFRKFFRTALKSTLGEVSWTAPQWLLRSQSRAKQGISWSKAHPQHAAAVASAVVVVILGGYFGWRWYQALPKPVTVDVTVSPPGRTCYECEPPKAPEPVTLKFAESSAPLTSVGKRIDANALNLDLSPAINGDWTWVDDRTLQFQPKSDWPIAQTYKIRVPKRGLVAPQIRLSQYKVEFTTFAFEARIESNEFYQDPVQANDKKIVTTLKFSHPVDTAALEERITLAAYDQITNELERKVASDPAFSVTYDKLKLHAFIHSSQLPVPQKAGRAVVIIASGLRAARGGNRTSEPLSASTAIPGLNSLSVTGTSVQIVRDERNEPSQALMLESNHSVTEKEMASHVFAWILPERNPDPKLQSEWESDHPNRPYPWSSVTQISPPVLAAARRLELSYVPNERDHVEQHSFRFKAAPDDLIYMRVDKGLESFGGYRMPDPADALLTVPEYPRELQIAGDGSLLALSGKRRLTVFSRDVPALQIKVARLLPNQLQHLVSQTTGSLSTPQWRSYALTANNLTETLTGTITLPKLEPGTPHYEGIDLGEFLSRPGASRLGVFLVSVQAWDPLKKQPIENQEDDNCEDCTYQAQQHDTRLVLLSDLALLVKKSKDGSQDVFVQSIQSGDPVSGVIVEIMGANGETVLHETSDATGHVKFPDLKSFKHEKKPVLYLARRGEDMTFLPIDERAHALDVSRFDVGGVDNVSDSSALSAYLFSDRGLYRPGDEIRAAAIVKSQDWRKFPVGLPLIAEITDPRGIIVKSQPIRLSESGFEEIRYTTRESSAAGTYTIGVSIVKERGQRILLGSATVTVRDFLPDRLRMATHFSAENREGWVTPDQLKANVTLENLFGTPASQRRIAATLRLSPAFPSFAAYPDFQFRDPQAAKQGYDENLAPQTTDQEGRASVPLDLSRFARATYRAALTVQGFEADGGRGVTNEVDQLVSNLPYLVGWKADGDLEYVSRGTVRKVKVIAIDPKAAARRVDDLVLDRIERRYVSMLLKQPNGTFKYESRLKEATLSTKPWPIAAGGADLPLETTTPGKFSYVLRDASGQVFARVDYAVAGSANLTRTLEKNAELQITLNKKDYAPEEEIEMQIQAPYTGAGLITIEREKVFTWHWFKTSTTSSVQKIRLPAGIEGNAYVQVTFVRDPASPEIYASPLSYGIQPFSIALNTRRSAVTLDSAELVQPGQDLAIRYRSERPSRIAIFAVDEGILQVAGYKTPDPLAYFFQKRALAVSTRQMLDLLLPEFREAMLSAPGGDAGAAIGRHLNPFKRKTDRAVAWWSGIVDADQTLRELHYTVPDYFNGRLRVMAVAVGDEAIGTAERTTTVRGDFVLSPNAPVTVVPGDEFDVSVGIANNVKASGADAKVAVTVQGSAALEIVGAASVSLPIGELRESSARFHVRTRDVLGGAALTFKASLPGHGAKSTATVSVRPSTPYSTAIQAGIFKGSIDVKTTRTLYPQFRTERASVSPLPLNLAHGLASYLSHYPYSCTEQIVSQALPALVLSQRPEFRYLKSPTGDPLSGLVDELRLRQTSEGAYHYWPGGVEVVDFISAYAQELLIESLERGYAVPQDLIDSGNRYLRMLARRDGNTLADERTAAFAVYLLARQGIAVGSELAALLRRLEDRYAKRWTTDLAAGYMAVAYQLSKQNDLAYTRLRPLFNGVTAGDDRFDDGLVAEARLLYLVSRYFPERLPKLPATLLQSLADRIGRGNYQSLSAATTILAFDAYAKALGTQWKTAFGIAAIPPSKSVQTLTLPAGLFPQVEFPATTSALQFKNQTELPGYYSVEESGFDRKPPVDAQRDGLEVIREYFTVEGKPASTIKVGEEIAVRVRFRAIGRSAIDDLVLVDLLPGGFDLSMPAAVNGAGPRVAGSVTTPTTVSGEYSQDEVANNRLPETESCGCGFLWLRPPQFPEYADMREDRVVLYGRATDSVQEFSYRIKATNAGEFASPPAYGESMYEPGIRARSTAAHLSVIRP